MGKSSCGYFIKGFFTFANGYIHTGQHALGAACLLHLCLVSLLKGRGEGRLPPACTCWEWHFTVAVSAPLLAPGKHS
jgi:hypothetical protein